jgi:hypothetical protein
MKNTEPEKWIVTAGRETYVMGSFMVCSSQRIFLGLSNQGNTLAKFRTCIDVMSNNYVMLVERKRKMSFVLFWQNMKILKLKLIEKKEFELDSTFSGYSSTYVSVVNTGTNFCISSVAKSCFTNVATVSFLRKLC